MSKKPKKARSIELSEILSASDLGARDLWKDLTDEQRKEVAYVVLVRYVSVVTHASQETQELAVLKANEYLNKHLFLLGKHPELLWYLFSMIGPGTGALLKHRWLGSKRTSNIPSAAMKFLEGLYPTLKISDLELIAKLSTTDDLRKQARDMGWAEAEIKKLVL